MQWSVFVNALLPSVYIQNQCVCVCVHACVHYCMRLYGCLCCAGVMHTALAVFIVDIPLQPIKRSAETGTLNFTRAIEGR